MFVSRALSRLSKSMSRSSLLFSVPKNHPFSVFSNQSHSLFQESPQELTLGHVSLFHHLVLNSSPFQRFGLSSSASPEPSDKEKGSSVENGGASTNGESAKTSSDGTDRSEVADQKEESDLEGESALSFDDLVKLVAEKEELLNLRSKEIQKMQDKVLRSYAEAENLMERSRREAENSKKFAIQNFAKGLLDVADNLSRASSVVKESYSKIDVSKDSSGAVPLLKTLLEGVEMTEKQLTAVFKKFGVEKFDPTNEPFDPHRHNAVFQIPDGSKPASTIAVVLKAGYILHDRVIRPAEVGVTQAVENNAPEENAA